MMHQTDEHASMSTRDFRSMRNRVDIYIELKGLPAGRATVFARREAASRLTAHALKEGVGASEAESFREMVSGLLDPSSGLKGGDVSYRYQADAATLDLDGLAGATACLPEGVGASVSITKDGSFVNHVDDPSDLGYWNYVLLEASGGNFTRQAIGHRTAPEGGPDEGTLREVSPGNFCRDMAEMGHMGRAFGAQVLAERRQREREAGIGLPVMEPEHDGREM